ncbi:MAG: D-ribose pyranase [Pseudomonadota bacterium]
MKRSGLLHAELARTIAGLGHGDIIVVGDAGLPVPNGVPVIDLAVTLGTPSFWSVLDAILDEMVVDHSVIAVEADTGVTAKFSDRLSPDTVLHDHLKSLCQDAVCVVRTGEAVPYTNVVLYAGVAF